MTEQIKNLETIANQFIGDCTINHAKLSKDGETVEWFELYQDGKGIYSSPYWDQFTEEVIAMSVDALESAKQF